MTIKELRERIDRYFEDCEASGVFPDEAGMALFLGLDRTTLEQWLRDENPRRAGYRKAIEDARLRRESFLVRGIYSSSSATTGKIFLSRQSSAGGLRDKSGDDAALGDGDLQVEVRIVGIEDCFD